MKPDKPKSIQQSLKCARVYPMEGSDKDLSKLKTLVLDLTPGEASLFAAALQKGASDQSLGLIRVVAFREPQKDGTHRLAVRGYKNGPSAPRGRRAADDEDYL